MKLLIIDDHILFAEGLMHLLKSVEKNITCHYAEDFSSAIEAITTNGTPDLIILDINLAGTNGFSLIEKFRSLNIWTPILVVSANNSPSTSLIAITKGASGFVSKSSDTKILLNAIKTVLNGEDHFPNDEQQNPTTKNHEYKASITTRQYEILHLLSQGMLNKQIALELSISENTVKAHLSHIFKELNASNRTAAVQNAQKYGLI